MKEQIGRLIQRNNLGFGQLVESAMLRRADDKPIELPLIAVCGPPRTGSTLIYQLVTQAIRAYVIDNFQNVFLHTPLLAWIARKRLLPAYVSDFESAGGFVRGLNGPAEAMAFWTYWCDQQLTEQPPHPPARRTHRLRRVMNAIHRRDGLPMIAGYLAHAFYMRELRALFPRIVFVRITRDLLSSAYSALRRWDVTGQPPGVEELFFGTRPREVLGCQSRTEYVARQQYFINQHMDMQQTEFPERVINVDYADICRDPRGAVGKIVSVCGQLLGDMHLRSDTAIPASFHESKSTPDRDADAAEINRVLHRLRAEHGRVSVDTSD